MAITRITIDTQALVWYVHKDLRRNLSERALNTVREAQTRGSVYVPTIMLIEALDLIDRGRITLSFKELMDFIDRNESYRVVPFDTDLLKVAIPLKGLEIHDRLILATAILTNSTLVSKDRMLTTRGVNVVW